MIGHRIKEIDIVARRGRDPFAADLELVCLCTREIAAVHGRHRAFPSCTNANGFGARAATVTCTERNSHPSGFRALHELATNSAKYGAFSVPDGAVVVQWSLCGKILLSWREVGGPPVVEPLRRGFGSTLIERSLVIETGGSSILRFPEKGCECEIRIPLSAIAHRPSFKPRATLAEPTTIGPARDRPLSVLVVEDSSLVLMMIEDAILDSGWSMVGPATRVDEALRLAETETFDIALLDINLDGEMSWAVAALLKSRGIPLMFSTGYDGAAVLPPEFSSEAIIAKPFTAVILRQRLSDLRDMALVSGAPSAQLLIEPPLNLAEHPLDG